MTPPRWKPPALAVGLAALFAGLAVWRFAQGRFDQEWAAFWGLFLILELTAAIAHAAGGTLSERVWSWTGVRPRRISSVWRAPAVGAFLAVLLAHFAQGGTVWWASGGAVAMMGLPVAAAIALGFRENRKGAA